MEYRYFSSPLTRIALIVGGVVLCITDLVLWALGDSSWGDAALIFLLGLAFTVAGITGVGAVRYRPRWWGNH